MSVDVDPRVGAHRLVVARPHRSRLYWVAHVVGIVGTTVAVAGVGAGVLVAGRVGLPMVMVGAVLASGAGMLAWLSAHRQAKR